MAAVSSGYITEWYITVHVRFKCSTTYASENMAEIYLLQTNECPLLFFFYNVYPNFKSEGEDTWAHIFRGLLELLVYSVQTRISYRSTLII